MRAAALLSAMIAAGGPMALARQRSGRAQEIPETRAVEWEADQPSLAAADIGDYTTIVTDFPVTAVAAHWPHDQGDLPIIEVRLSNDGVTYGDSWYLSVDADLGRETREDRYHTHMVASSGAKAIQYRVLDQQGDPAAIDGLVIAYLDTSEGPSPGDLPSASAATTDPATPPRIITRAEWGANESYRYRNGVELWPVTYATVEHAIVHHSETSNVQNPVEAVRSIYYYHAITRDWGDVAYNFLIDRFGNIYEGRVGGQNAVGGHALLHNVGSSGICMVGNFILQDMSTAAKSSLVAILAWVVRDLDPLGAADFWFQSNLPTIAAHRDVGQTTCPGDFAYDDLPTLRTLVAQVLSLPQEGPPGGLTIGDTVQVATDDGGPLNLRSAPGLTASLVTSLPNGTLAIIVDGAELVDGFNWYMLSTNLGSGWAAADYLELAPPGQTGGGMFEIGDYVLIDVDMVNLYGMPTSTANILYRVPRGYPGFIANGPKFNEGQIWYQFDEQFLNGGPVTGWSPQERFKLSPVPPNQPKFFAGDTIRTTTSLRLRTGPSTSATIITTMEADTTGKVISGPHSGSSIVWYQIQVPAGTGYAAEAYLELVTPAPSPTASPSPDPNATSTPTRTPSPTPTSTPTRTPTVPGSPLYVPGDVVETTSGLNLRSSPSTSGLIISTMPAGTRGTVVSGPVTASGYDWWQIAVPYGTGWAAGLYLKKAVSNPSPPPGATFQPGDVIITTSSVNLRSAPSTSAGIITLLPGGAIGTVVTGPEFTNGYEWWRIAMSQGTGWSVKNYLAKTSAPTPTPPAPVYSPGDSVRTTTSLRLRTSPSASATVIKIMSTGAICTVQGGPQYADGYTWWRVLNGGDTGWAAGAYLTPA